MPEYWWYKEAPFEIAPENMIGFVYVITNLSNNKKYFGQKVFFNKKTRKPLKGKTQKRHSKVESDWLSYRGSSEQLQKDIEALGIDSFKKEIICLLDSKALMNYYETLLQMKNNVLAYPDKFYNGIVNVRTSRKQLTKHLDSLGDVDEYLKDYFV